MNFGDGVCFDQLDWENKKAVLRQYFSSCLNSPEISSGPDSESFSSDCELNHDLSDSFRQLLKKRKATKKQIVQTPDSVVVEDIHIEKEQKKSKDNKTHASLVPRIIITTVSGHEFEHESNDVNDKSWNIEYESEADDENSSYSGGNNGSCTLYSSGVESDGTESTGDNDNSCNFKRESNEDDKNNGYASGSDNSCIGDDSYSIDCTP